MRVGIASEWVGERVGGLERQSADLIRSMVSVDSVNQYVVFVTARGARALGGLAGERTAVRPTAFSSRWYYVPVGLPLSVLRNRVDVLHAMFTVVPWCPAPRVVLTVHDVCPDVHPEFFPPGIRARFRWLLARGVARADRIIVPSALTRGELLQHYDVDGDKVVVIPDGVRETMHGDEAEVGEPFDPARWPSDFVLYVGRFHARKNLERLLEAYARSTSRRHGLRLILAGRDLWSGERIKARIAELGLESDVICPGHVSDTTLGCLYRRARAFVFPSLHEGFGIPPLEAMAHDVPVLACRISAMPEVLGDAAHYTDPYDTEAMASSLDELVSNDALRDELIRRGRHRAAIYAWPRVAGQTLELYNQVASLS
jgi:glycosyltransferase involved in cell wall biosynthesis